MNRKRNGKGENSGCLYSCDELLGTLGTGNKFEGFAKDGLKKPRRQDEVGEIKDRKSRSLEWRPLLRGHQNADSNIRPKA